VRISKEFGIPHISTGDILRQAVKDKTELGKAADACMSKGELVPDTVVIGIVVERTAQPDCGNGYLLDGFPRTVAQAEALDKSLKELGGGLDAVVSLEVDEDEVVRRLSSRKVCSKCGAIYSTAGGAVAPEKCDSCSGEVITRADDQPDAIRRRLEVYKQLTEPLIGYYSGTGILKGVKATGTVDEVFARIESTLGKR
jgi:adenylate kinase